MQMKALDLDFTRGCNMNCNHCFADAHTPMPNELTTDEYKTILDQAAPYAAQLSRVSWGLGGEALTRPDLFELLEHAAALGLPNVLTTNGMLITEKGAARLAATGVRVSISIDGATDETHEALRIIPGSLQLAIRGIQRLKKAGCPVGINTTLTKHNVHELPQILDLAERLEVDHVSLGNIMPFGRALLNPELILDDDDYRWVLEVGKARLGYPIPVSTFDGVLDFIFNLQSVLDTGKFTPKATSAGRGKVVVRPDGEVWPCQLLPLPAGNVRTHTLEEILHSPVFDEVREQVEEHERGAKTVCGGPCACTKIMNNESDEFKAAAVSNWANMTVELPDEVGRMVKEALVARRAKASA